MCCCCCCFWHHPLQEHPQGQPQCSSCPCLCEEVTVLGSSRDPSASRGEPGIATTGATTAPLGYLYILNKEKKPLNFIDC